MDDLFGKTDLAGQLSERQRQVAPKIDAIEMDRFVISSDQEIVEHVLPQLFAEPIALHLDDSTVTPPTEAPVLELNDPVATAYPDGPGGSSIRQGRWVQGTRVDISIPFTGDDWIFGYRASKYRLDGRLPRGKVKPGHLLLSIELPAEAPPQRFKETRDNQIDLIRECVENARNQIEAYNCRLESLVREAIAARRSRLANHARIAELLDIPVAPKPGAPSIKPVRIEVRRPPSLPVPPKTGLRPEPGIPDETYEQILHFIRHQGRTFETTPGTYALHDEEGLRNIVLGQLNGQFEGAAKGEAFRGRGKTDICIETDNRAAFVGECKLWTGPASLTGALDQLLGYLTWRDSKASVIVFNTQNRYFSKVLSAVPDTIRGHNLFVRDLPCEETGEWRVLMRSEEDEGRRVTVHVFLFNLYQAAQRR